MSDKSEQYDPETARDRLLVVQGNIARAAEAAGRDVSDVTLIAVSKTQPADAIVEAIEAGQVDFGENRVQEALEKWPALKDTYPHVRLHLIGNLQRNKMRDALGLFDVIHTIDRPKLAAGLARAARPDDRRPGQQHALRSGVGRHQPVVVQPGPKPRLGIGSTYSWLGGLFGRF